MAYAEYVGVAADFTESGANAAIEAYQKLVNGKPTNKTNRGNLRVPFQ